MFDAYGLCATPTIVLYGRIRRVGKVDNRKMLRTKPKAHSRQDDSPQIPQEGPTLALALVSLTCDTEPRRAND
jgi:hypothetical protein